MAKQPPSPAPAGAFAAFMAELADLGPIYCANVKRVLQDAEVRKIAEIYEAGLTSALSGTAAIFASYFSQLPASQQQEIDQFIAASGGQAMLQAANAVMRDNFLGNAIALSSIPKIVELAKRIIRNFVALPIPLDKLLRKIDLFVDGINDLFGGGQTGPQGGQTVSAPTLTLRSGESRIIQPEPGKTIARIDSSNPDVVATTVEPNNTGTITAQAPGSCTVTTTYTDGTSVTNAVNVVP
jgi:hypothetical protein